MKINITKKNAIISAVSFLAGLIIATTGCFIFTKCNHKDHKRMGPPSFSQSQEIGNKQIDPKSPSNSKNEFKNSENQDGQENGNRKSKPESKNNSTASDSDNNK